MGNQNNHSVARKRLSTLAISTTLAAVGVGVVGAGAANAATQPASTNTGTSNPQVAAPVAAVAVTPGTGSTSLTASADLTGTTVDKSVAATATGTIVWDTAAGTKPTPITFDPATGLPTETKLTNTYAAAGTYTVTVTVNLNDAANTTVTKTANVTVTDATLAASLSATSATKGKAVSLDLTGSSVDKSITNAVTVINWGDSATNTTFAGDPSLIKVGDAKLSHSYTADGTYTVKVTLDDGLKTKTSVQTKTFSVTVSETGVQVLRASGDDRYGTGLAISKHQWADTGVTTDTRMQAKAVVLATGDDFADALVGVPLAKKAQGPLLLTDGSLKVTNPDVLKEIQRVLPTKGTTVYILGGDKAITPEIEKQIQSLGYTTNRLAGEDRFATSLKIAQVGMQDPAHLVVARGDEGNNHDGFADALAAGPYAADVWGGGNSAVVLTNFNTFDPATKAYVTSKLKAGQVNVAAIGGQAAGAMTTIKGSASTSVSSWGSTRYETAAKVAAAFEPKGKNAPIGVATGLLFPDALTGGAYMASTNGPLLLTDPSVLSPATAAEIADVAKTVPQISIFGGEKAVTPAVAKAIATLAGVTTIGKF